MEFGKFFRRTRTALGISGREFCRRNNLDPSNLSRLELGRLRPPQSKEILESYAKALSLQPDSPQWHKFFELAALENGMVPPQIQESQALREKLPLVLRKHREETKHQQSWTTALDLDAWADSSGSSFTLPRLIRQLVRNTTPKLTRVEFPAGEGVRRPGWDGFIEASEGNEFVPDGISAWEMGTDKHPSQKAEKDFNKRTEHPPLGLDTRQLFFIFVTPRKWIKKNEWCEEKKRLGLWKDVRVYDSSILEEWLETSMSTDIWFSKLIGKRPEGITSIGDHWKNLSVLAKPAFHPDVFLVSRADDIKELKQWLEEPASSLAIEAHSPNEIIDFVSAYIASLPDDHRDIVELCTVIVEDRAAWNLLCNSNSKFNLIPKPSLALEAEMISGAVRQGHHVLLCQHRCSGENADNHRLSRVYGYDLEKALTKSGFNESEAHRLAGEAGGSLTVLKRRLPGFPGTNRPAWSKSPEADDLLPFLLVGGWDDNSKADQKILSTLAGRSYEGLLLVANRWLSSDDPLIIRVHSSWGLLSRDDSWELLAPKLLAQHLDAFEKIAFEILSEDDPRYDLPAEERWYAAMKNKTQKFSSRLRKGISETLTLMGAEGVSRVTSTPESAAFRAERIIGKVMAEADWKRWASLELPLLAEAAPETFLNAVEKDLASSEPELPKLFIEEGDSIMSSCTHADVLWALETLAWSPIYLLRTTLVLAHLAQIDPPGGKWANRPINSLREIFLPWLPQTTATVDERIVVLEKLFEEMPPIGSKLLLELLPSPHSSSMHTRRPAWRGWALGWSCATNREFWKQSEWCAEKLVQSLDTDETLWEKLIDKIEDLPKKAFDLLMAKLQTADLSKLPDSTKQQIFDALREKINRHRSFADAEWAMPNDILNVLDAAMQRFEPTDLIQKNKWLFANWPELPEERGNFEKRNDVIFEKRLQVLREILEMEGLERLLELAQCVEASYAMGVVLGKTNLLSDDSKLLPKFLASKKSELANLAKGYAIGRFVDVGEKWVNELKLDQWHYEEVGNLLLVLPFERKTWNLAEACGEQVLNHYWSARTSDFYRGTDPKDIEYAISQLLHYQRPLRAIDVISMAKYGKCEVSPVLIMDVLDAVLKLSKDMAENQINTHNTYEIQELFKFLQSVKDIDQERLVTLEWAYLGLLGEHRGASPKTLHTAIQSDPKFFAQLLSWVFPSKNEPKKSLDSTTERESVVARNAYKLLTSLKQIPGIREDGSVDDKKLVEWVTQARVLCKESGRLEACDGRIGEMFAYAPADPDGSWPCTAVRGVIEKVKNDELERGFTRGIYNKRGIHSRALTDGGKPEHKLAYQYSEYANKCNLRWPRTATALRHIASSYEREAQLEDEKVEARLD